MSHTNSTEIKRPKNVVRLAVDGAKNPVNTLRDQETGRGISLVCPFPALEVDIPVKLGDGEKRTDGAIHRIGVEDDPRTGLPRLRLSIRTLDTRSTAITKTADPLPDISKMNEEEEEPVMTDMKSGPMVRPLVSWADALGKEVALLEADVGSDDEADLFNEPQEEPGWVECREMPLPEEFLSRTKTRRRFRIAKHMAIAFVLGMLVAAGYLLDRAGMISFSTMSDQLIAYVDDDGARPSREPLPILVENTSQGAPKKSPAAPLTEEAPIPATPITTAEESEAVTASAETASYSPGANPLLDEKTPETIGAAQPSEAADESSSDSPDAEQAEEGAEAEEEVSQDTTLTLPTRWPVEYATAYRIRDPNGVVVDVPGGLVRREGWLEAGRDNPMVRSIKAIQRESGARFVVYVNGDLPRFMTNPKGAGVSLRLYYDQEAEDTTTVASLASSR
jgi:hypothetical protein